MPIFSTSQIVGGGAQLLAPVTVNTIPRVVDVGPPGALSDSLVRQFTDGAVQVITVGPVNPRTGVAATESFRLAGGFISEGAGADSVVAGRGAVASQTDGIAVGRAASAVGGPAIAIGAAASAPANSCISIGGTSSNASNALIIGIGASGASNGGSPQLMVIGTNATGGQSGTGGVVSLVIGNSSVGRRNDVVIGHGSSSNTTTADNNNLLVGNGIICNISAGGNVLIGNFNTVTTGGTFNHFFGRSSSTTGSQNIVLGSGVAIGALSNQCFIGAGSTDIQTITVGSGISAVSPAARNLRFTIASGTNNLAGDFTIDAPRSTGNANPAAVVIRASQRGASGSTAQPPVEMLRISGDAANVGIFTFAQTRSNLIGPSGNPVISFGANTLSFFNATPQAQSGAIADAAGGATIDAEARTALNALLAYLRLRGDIAP